MLVLNCLDRENAVTIGGNTFTFAPRQLKNFYQEEIGKMIAGHRAHLGFVAAPDELEYLTVKPRDGKEIKPDEEHKTLLSGLRQQGIDAYVENLRRLIYNEQVSLKLDMERSGDKSDPRLSLKPKMIQNMEEVIQYQSKKEDAAQIQLDKVKELEKKLAATK